MTTTTVLSMISGALTILAAYYWWLEVRAKAWTPVQGRIVEVAPRSLFEGNGSSLSLNLDTDHVVEYQFDGQTFQHVISDEASINISGLKIWRRAPAPGEILIKVNPERPKQFFGPAHKGQWKYLFAFAVVVGLGALWTSFRFHAG